MDEFKKLTDDWGKIKAENSVHLNGDGPLMKKLKKLQKKIVFSNLFTSVAFAIVFIVAGWVWYSNPNEKMQFYASIATMFALLGITLFFTWRRVLYWRKPDLSTDIISFLNKTIKKLHYQIWLSRVFTPLYLMALALIFYFYLDALVSEASVKFKIFAYGITFGWIIFAGVFGYIRRNRKNNREIKPLLEEFCQLRDNLRDNPD